MIEKYFLEEEKIDFILVSSNSYITSSILEPLLDHENLGFPNTAWGSDHLLSYVQIKLQDASNIKNNLL